MKHFHWEFLAYDQTNGEGNPALYTEVTVKGYQSEAVALEAVKNIITRRFYWLRKVWECTQCDFQENMLEQFKKMSDDHEE